MAREMKLVSYLHSWKEDFQIIKKNLKAIFGNIAINIEHFGSTAIEGMASKPIIDVMIIVYDIVKVDDLKWEMLKQGYIDRGDNGILGRRYFVKFAKDGLNHIEHIHCYEENNPHVIDELMFRNYLRINKKAFDYYLNTKMEAAYRYPHDSIGYTAYKAKCISEIMIEARKHYYQFNHYKDFIDITPNHN